jgi:hypothetical protein
VVEGGLLLVYVFEILFEAVKKSVVISEKDDSRMFVGSVFEVLLLPDGGVVLEERQYVRDFLLIGVVRFVVNL